MKKLEKELFIKHANRLQAIINDSSTFVPFLKRNDFSTVLKNELNVLSACEQLFPKEELETKLTSKALVKEFNKLTNQKFKLDERYKYEDETDLIDSINYLFTFCNNMFRVNLDDLVNGKKITATDPKIDLKAKVDFDDGGAKINPNLAFAGGIPLAATPYENPYLVGKAYAKLNDDMNQGRFYRFKTQPKIILIVKWIILISLMLMVLALITSSVLAFIASNLPLQNAEGQTGSLNEFGAIGSGVLYLLMGVFCAYPSYLSIKDLKGKNLNTKYYLNWTILAMFILLGIIVIMPDMRITWLLETRGIFIPEEAISTSAYVAFQGWKIMYIVSLSLLAPILIPMVIGAIMNPKPDVQKVEAKIKEYIDLFSSESTQSGVPPSVDNQKPVDVKSKDEKTKK